MSTKSYHHGDLRRVLLDKAERELTDNGVEAFSMRGVARRAGVSHAAPAHHFGDTNGMLTALATSGFELVSDQVSQIVDAAEVEGRDLLKQIASAYIDFVGDRPDLAGLMFSSKRVDVQAVELDASITRFFDQFVTLVRGLPEASGQSEEEVLIAVTAAWSMIHGFAELVNSDRLPQALADTLPDRDWLIGVYIDQLIGGQGS